MKAAAVLALALSACSANTGPAPTPARPEVPADLLTCPAAAKPPLPAPPPPRTTASIADALNRATTAYQATAAAHRACADRLSRLNEWIATH